MAEEIELTAYCGLYCGDCIRCRSRVSDLARDLLSELRNIQFSEYAKIKSGSVKQLGTVKQFEHYGKYCDVLEAIAALQCSTPCRVAGGCLFFSCEILECCRQKDFEGCWQCDGFESCERFDVLRSVHGDSPRRDLKTIKELGLAKWMQHRHKPYAWQQ